MATNIAPTPAQAANSTAAPVYGQVTVDGLSYIERPQLFVMDVPITAPNAVLPGQRLTLPGVADFLLKGLSQISLYGNFPNQTRSGVFRFRLNNAEGTTWFFTGALGVFDDRVFSPLCFGTGQFPFPLIPPVPVHASGSLVFDIEDVGVSPPGVVYPYTIHLGFHGAYLIPATGAGAGQGPLAFGTGSGTLSTGGS